MSDQKSAFKHAQLSSAERHLSANDHLMGSLIAADNKRWPSQPTENPLWGLVRIIMAQQVSTLVACRIAEKALLNRPDLLNPCQATPPEIEFFRSLGMPQRRAQCCVQVIRNSQRISGAIAKSESWEHALQGIKGIGPWTLSVFKIMVLRDPDVLPLGDVGLERAVNNIYGNIPNIEELSDKWRPYRSVACWYLWRTLGNLQLG